MPITTKLVGGLGNQLFQIANCIAHALRHGMTYEIPNNLTPGYEKYTAYLTTLPVLKTDIMDFGIYREPSFNYSPVPRKEQICFDGYFQSWKYFDDVKTEVKALLQKAVYDSLISKRPDFKDLSIYLDGCVAIHIRRGDYVEYSEIHPPVSFEYLRKAILHFYNNGFKVFTIYSDDTAWCKQHLQKEVFFIAPEADFNFFEYKNSDHVASTLFDFFTMSKHPHQITSNSTFSLWAAMLNDNPSKIVICPDESNWFGKDAGYDASDIIPSDFLRIKY